MHLIIIIAVPDDQPDAIDDDTLEEQ